MATITVKMTDDDIRAACMNWAVTRILNEGAATGCTIEISATEGGIGDVIACRVEVETERMSKPLPRHIHP